MNNVSGPIALIVLVVVLGVVSSFGAAQCSRGCAHSEYHNVGDISVKVLQESGSFLDCNNPDRYKLVICNRGNDRVVIKILVGKEKLFFEVDPKVTHTTMISSPSSPVIKRLTICKKGSCVRLK